MSSIDPDRQICVDIIHEQGDAYASLLAEHCPELETRVLLPAKISQSDLGRIEILLTSVCPLPILTAARNLRWLQCTNAGVDFLEPLAERLAHVLISNARGIHGNGMADYALGMITMWTWNIRELLHQQAAKRWAPKFVDCLAGKTLLIVGLGSIGMAIAERGKAAGLHTIGIKRQPVRSLHHVDEVYAPQQLAAALPQADYIVIAAPSTAQTRRMFGAQEFALMKPSAFFVNIARGDLVDEGALTKALATHVIAGAALDVFETEPLPPDNPLWAMNNVIITPHISGNPSGYHDQICRIFADNLQRFKAGQALRNLVDLQRGY
jgi:phosphoglycerate dehydrogenase-like enzyme